MSSIAIKADRTARWPHLALAWALGRVVLLGLLVYLLRAPLLNAVEAAFDIVGVTLFAIDRASTPLTRGLLALGAGLAFFAIAKASVRVAPQRAYLVALAGCALAAALLAMKIGGGLKVAAAIVVILAANWASLSAFARIGVSPALVRRLIEIPPAFGEIFLASRYLDWLCALARGAPAPAAQSPRHAPGAIVAALALAVLSPGEKLVKYEQALRMGPDVRIFAQGDFNGLAFDAKGNRLFATGHGAARALSFDAANLSAPPLQAGAATGGAQGLAFAPGRGEIYIYNSAAQEILALDAATLARKRTIPAPDISPGDSWIAFDPRSDAIVVASEADRQIGHPLVIFDRASGAAIAERADEAGNLLINPDAPILYMSFFRRVGGVVAYDLKAQRVIASAPTDARMDRMAYDPLHRSLLIASPAEGRIEEFDAATLAPKGAFPAIFGVRVMAIDAPRRVMLVGSLASGKVALMGLDDHKLKRSWYLGPWLRSIVIAPGKGVAYVSSEGRLYELRYAARG